jgi:hypothetical protein
MYQRNGIVVAHITLNLNIFILVKLSDAYILLCVLHNLSCLLFFEFLLLNSFLYTTDCITIFMYVYRLIKSLNIDIPLLFVNEST